MLRGVYEGKFTQEELYAVLPLDAEEIFDGSNDPAPDTAGANIILVANSEPKSANDDDLRESLVKFKLLAGIPDEPFQLDIGDEVKKIVDRLLDGKE
ncbi:MAG TPA: hypothetical protein VGI40_03810 [Pirellulaceae bacterium]